jgi:glycosyltransferase involved in cell wall biosynthesis
MKLLGFLASIILCYPISLDCLVNKALLCIDTKTEFNKEGVGFPFDEKIYELVRSDELLENQLASYCPAVQRHIVVVIPSYNNANNYKRNLSSVYAQDYQNYSVIYIDDASTDGTADLCMAYIRDLKQENRTRLIKNTVNRGALANLYDAVHGCDPECVIVNLDGDDSFAKGSVLTLINKVYDKFKVLMTYGTYQHFPYNGYAALFCKDIPPRILAKRAYRDMPSFSFSHLRTYKAALFQLIAKKDLMYDGKFFDAACDVAISYPMAESSGDRIMRIPDIVYLYNIATPLNVHKLKREKQELYSEVIKNRQKYPVLVE